MGDDPINFVDPMGLDRLINPNPGWPPFGPHLGPTITFINDDPKGPSTNLPVSDATAQMIEDAVAGSGLDININSTRGGTHDENSHHPSGKACDINRVGGRPVGPNNQDAQDLQNLLNRQPNIRENFGPTVNTKTLNSTTIPMAPPTVSNMPGQSRNHRTHIHVSGQR